MPLGLSSHDRTVSQLVERQMRNWELARSQSYAELERPSAEVRPFIALSRMAGNDPATVAGPLGERLGWPVFDREILDQMAGDDALRRQVYGSLDQRDVGWWESAVRGLMEGDYVRNDYFHRLCQTLLSLARQGSCVFVGRGADLILPAGTGLRVRLVAPLETRLETWQRVHRVDAAEARVELERLERQRAAFIQGHFGVAADDPARADLTINVARVEPPRAVELILAARPA